MDNTNKPNEAPKQPADPTPLLAETDERFGEGYTGRVEWESHRLLTNAIAVSALAALYVISADFRAGVGRLVDLATGEDDVVLKFNPEVSEGMNEQIKRKLLNATVRMMFRRNNVQTYDYREVAGFFIDEGTIVTAEHALVDGYILVDIDRRGFTADGGETTIDVWNLTKNPKNLPLIATDPTKDMAVVRFEKPLVESDVPLNVSKSLLASGDTIATCGHPFGLTWEITAGKTVKTEKWRDRSVQYYVFDMTALPGNSGGPVINEHGEVVSILDNRSGMPSVDAQSYGPVVTVEDIAALKLLTTEKLAERKLADEALAQKSKEKLARKKRKKKKQTDPKSSQQLQYLIGGRNGLGQGGILSGEPWIRPSGIKRGQ